MTDRDPAFLWETEALRAARTKARPPVDPPAASPRQTQGWRTIRQAHETTGIPVGTLRKWARLGAIPSYLDASGDQSRRMVKMDSVLERAAAQGRSIAPVAVDTSPPDVVVDLREERPSVSRDGAKAPPGTMIVPIAAWDKMLMQLGNLHEAGQQLAEARERAARAETEASFLRERLSELRRETAEKAEHAQQGLEERGAPRPAESLLIPAAPRPPSRTAQLWRVMLRTWTRRRR